MFGGDAFLEFFVRMVIKFARRLGADDWRPFDAIVVSSERKTTFTGCILVVVNYRFRNADARIAGTFKQPFINGNYADAYLRRYPGGSKFPVLVSPRNPSRSIPAEGVIAFTKAG